jgi:hypothetical protein
MCDRLMLDPLHADLTVTMGDKPLEEQPATLVGPVFSDRIRSAEVASCARPRASRKYRSTTVPSDCYVTYGGGSDLR